VKKRNIYEVAKVKDADFLRRDEAKFLVFMITNKCGIDFGIGW